MDGCSLNMTVSALACAIAKGKTKEELSVLSAVFTQLGDALETIAAAGPCDTHAENDNNICVI